jgi:hypothetical protein
VASSRVPPLFTATAIACGAYFLQCGPEEPTVELPPVIYGGIASDEAFERVWPKIASAEVSTTLSAQLTAPMNGATIPAGTAPTFTWTLAGAQKEAIRGGRVQTAQAFLSFGSAPALAHLPPVTGNVYLLELTTTPGEANPLRVFTNEMSWTADPDSWARMKAATGAITVKLYNAYVNANILEEGPYTRSEASTFNVGSI